LVLKQFTRPSDVGCTMTLRSFKFRVSAERSRPITRADYLCDHRGGRCITITGTTARRCAVLPQFPAGSPAIAWKRNFRFEFQRSGYC
jgi:hypothetical protein